MSTVHFARLLIPFGILASWMTGWSSVDYRSPEALQTWWQSHQDPAEWNKVLSDLASHLLAQFESQGEACFQENSEFMGQWNHGQWLAMHKGVPNDPNLQAAFIEIGQRPEVRDVFLAALDSRDHEKEALGIFLKLFHEEKDAFPRYGELAAAFAVVFDVPFPVNWPHHQVARAQVPLGKEDPLERFRYYVALNESRKTEYDLTELPVSKLIFVVDSVVDLAEFTWVQEKGKMKLSQLDRAFYAVQYDIHRMKKQTYDWPHQDYRLETILKEGGICVDQAYFAAQSGKAIGVPTLYFVGQGTDGGHAWFGYLKKKNDWDMDVGRYESQNYPVGHALNPQRWEYIKDTELVRYKKDAGLDPAVKAGREALRFIRMGRTPEQRIKIAECAIRLDSQNIDAWRWLASFHRDQKATAELRSVLDRWILQFDKQIDDKVEGQTLLLAVMQEQNDPAAEALRKSIQRENRKKRFDIGIDSGASAVIEMLDAENWDGAENEFRKLLRRFDDHGGGSLFYSLVEPYVLACLEAGHQDRALAGMKYAERRMSPARDSILEMEFQKLAAKLEKAAKL
ncbi:MAG: hypothetical protein ACFCUX_05510 [Candidatus Methylacidiphilales bacterium]